MGTSFFAQMQIYAFNSHLYANLFFCPDADLRLQQPSVRQPLFLSRCRSTPSTATCTPTSFLSRCRSTPSTAICTPTSFFVQMQIYAFNSHLYANLFFVQMQIYAFNSHLYANLFFCPDADLRL